MLWCQLLAEMQEFVARLSQGGVERRPAQHGRVADVPKANRPPKPCKYDLEADELP